MKNFQELANKFYSLSFSLSLKSAFIRITAFAVTIAIFFINMAWVDVSEPNIFVHIAGTIVSTLLVPALFIIISSPLTKMAITSFYLKMRHAKGSFGHSGTAEESKLSKLTEFTTKRKIFTAASLVLALLAGNLAYITMVTPMTKPVSYHLAIEKIADSENAWIEYDIAIHSLIEMPMLARLESKEVGQAINDATLKQIMNPIFGKFEKIIEGEAEITAEEEAFIKKHEAAIEHLLKGAKLPKAQFFYGVPKHSSPVPNLLQMRALTNLAAVKVQYLQKQGKVQEAVDLALATYKMATDIGAEQNTSLISALISVVCKGITIKSLINLIKSQTTTAEMDREIARKVTEQNLRMPNTYQLFSSERQSLQNSLEETFIKGNLSEFREVKNPVVEKLLFDLVPGLRVRTYNTFVELNKNTIDSMRSRLENWDFVEAKKANDQFAEKTNFWNLPWKVEDFLSSMLFYNAFPNACATMKSLYGSDVFTKYLISQAACSAYKKTHGRFPTNLEAAMSEANLAMVTDLATNKPIGYRLDNGSPVFWFAGVDGKDDGGHETYTRETYYSPVSGKDMVFNYGDFFLKKNNSSLNNK
jgi:hypothetical protein